MQPVARNNSCQPPGEIHQNTEEHKGTNPFPPVSKDSEYWSPPEDKIPPIVRYVVSIHEGAYCGRQWKSKWLSSTGPYRSSGYTRNSKMLGWLQSQGKAMGEVCPARLGES